MDFKKILVALNSKKRQEMIHILYYEDLSAPDVYKKMKFAPTFRQSVNRDLDSLVEAGILEKYYSNKKKQILFKLRWKSLEINFETLKILGKEK